MAVVRHLWWTVASISMKARRAVTPLRRDSDKSHSLRRWRSASVKVDLAWVVKVRASWKEPVWGWMMVELWMYALSRWMWGWVRAGRARGGGDVFGEVLVSV